MSTDAAILLLLIGVAIGVVGVMLIVLGLFGMHLARTRDADESDKEDEPSADDDVEVEQVMHTNDGNSASS